MRVDAGPVPTFEFCGTIKNASDRVLQLLVEGSDVLDARAADDLQSLVGGGCVDGRGRGGSEEVTSLLSESVGVN